jgi:type I restriction enzyme R subunit
VTADLNPASKRSDLAKAWEPVADRLMRQHKAARERLKAAKDAGDDATAEEANEEVQALDLFKRDMISFGLAYTFLCQIFDYGNTALEKRAIFYKRLIPLLEFGRDRDGVDLSKVMLTHHTLRARETQSLPLGEGESPLLKPLTDSGSGSVQETEKERLSEIIAKVNDLFGADTTEGDKLVYVNNVIKEKLMESETLRQQAANNSKEQFANSPDLEREITNAIMDAETAMSSLSKEALESERVRSGLKDVLMGPAQLYEALRASFAIHP